MTRRMPNLNQLRTFEAAARLASFKHAADELHVTHAAVSHQIKALEAELGQQLFNRKTRGVELTHAASVFAARLSDIFSELASACDAVVSHQMEGQLNITMAPYFANRLVIPRLSDFHDTHPGLTVQPHLSWDMLDLRSADFHAAVRYGTGDWPGLCAIKLIEDGICPVASPAFIKAITVPMQPSEIASLPLARNVNTPDEWSDWFNSAGHPLSVQPNFVDYTDRAQCTDFALSGNGVALVHAHLIKPDIAAGRLVRLNPLEVGSSKSTFAVFQQTDFPDPRVIAFIDWLRAVLSEG